MEFTLKEEIIDKQNLIIASIGIIQVVVKNIIRNHKVCPEILPGRIITVPLFP